MTSSERRLRFPVVLTVVSALALALLIGLGVWQVQRLQWKEGLIAQAAAAEAAPPAPLEALLASNEPIEFRRVLVDCPGLSSAPYVELQTIQDGQAGVRLISACPVGERVWLVDRGFVAETISARPPVTASAEPVSVTAIARTPSIASAMAPAPAGNHFYARDADAMARALGVTGPVAEQTLFALTNTNEGWQALQPSAPPPAFSNNHLGYALTWFGLALALVAFYVALLRRRMRG